MITTTEIWKPVEGYEGRYEVSSLGTVRSLNYKRTGQVRNLAPARLATGYLAVNLRDGRSSKTTTVHRLVALAFVEGYEPHKDVNHKNGVKDDNNYQNLEWLTRAQNLDHARNILGNQKDRPIVLTNLRTGVSSVFPTRASACAALCLDGRTLRKVLKGELRKTGGYSASYLLE